WILLGPFDVASGDVAARWSVARLDELPASDPRVAIGPRANVATDVALVTATQELLAVPGGQVSPAITRASPRLEVPGARAAFVDDHAALLHDTPAWTTIHPQPDGDVHLVIDFGREIIGYPRLCLDAPAGAII